MPAEQIEGAIELDRSDGTAAPKALSSNHTAWEDLSMVLHLFFLMGLDAQIRAGLCSTD